MDAMKYSMEADKYRAAYMPPSTLAMSMYSDGKYLDSSPKSYLDRSYLDSAKAYFEQSKLYMDQQQQKPSGLTDYSRHSVSGYEVSKLYEDASPGGAGGSLSRSPAAESPDGLVSKGQNSSGNNDGGARNDLGSSSASSSASTTTSSPGAASLSSYYSGAQASGLLGPQVGQYTGYQTAPTGPGNEFRRPLTVIF
jgi:transcription factor SOX1/3/14/21 (SOX group B)